MLARSDGVLGSQAPDLSAGLAITPDNFFVFLAPSGYLFGRKYSEVVALRRLDRMAIRPVCQGVAAHVPRTGVARRVEGLRRIEPHLLAS